MVSQGQRIGPDLWPQRQLSAPKRRKKTLVLSSGSLKMALFDRWYTNYYWAAILSTALSCRPTVFKLFDINNIVTLKSGLRVTQVHWKWHHSKAWVWFLFNFHSNYGSVLYHFWDEVRYWSKIFVPPCIWCPVRAVPVRVLWYHLVLKNSIGVATIRWKKFKYMFSLFVRIFFSYACH